MAADKDQLEKEIIARIDAENKVCKKFKDFL